MLIEELIWALILFRCIVGARNPYLIILNVHVNFFTVNWIISNHLWMFFMEYSLFRFALWGSSVFNLLVHMLRKSISWDETSSKFESASVAQLFDRSHFLSSIPECLKEISLPLLGKRRIKLVWGKRFILHTVYQFLESIIKYIIITTLFNSYIT